MMLSTDCNKLEKLLKTDFGIAKLAKFGKISSIVCYLLPWQLHIWFCKWFYFWIMQYKSQTKSMMLFPNSNSLQKLLKLILKKANKAKLGYMS